MKLEVGKFYKTWSGDKVKILSIDSSRYAGLPALGELYVHGGEEVLDMFCWTLCGNIHKDLRDGSTADIMEEWKDPREAWIAMDASGEWCIFDKKPELRKLYGTWVNIDGGNYAHVHANKIYAAWHVHANVSKFNHGYDGRKLF